MRSGYLGLYKGDLPVDYAESFMSQFTEKTGEKLILIVNSQLATKEKLEELRAILREENA